MVAYITASRKLSGKIGTSEAATLWSESTKIRDDYRTQIHEANTRIAACEARVAAVETLNNDLVRENFFLGQKVERLERENSELRALVTSLKEQLDAE